MSAPAAARRPTWWPTMPLISTRLMETRKRRGLMVAIVLLTVALPVLVLGIRLLLHAVDPSTYGPAGSPDVFSGLTTLALAQFGFVAAATLGAFIGTSDLTDGVFRHLVITGRSRLALYFARIPAGLAIMVPLIAVTFAAVCLVCSFESAPAPSSIQLNGVSLPTHLNQSEFEAWGLDHPRAMTVALPDIPGRTPAEIRTAFVDGLPKFFAAYETQENANQTQPINEMIKIGLWLELEIVIGLVVGLGLGSLLGQRTVATIMMFVLQIIITPIIGNVSIPYFVNGQRLIVGVAMDQLRPAGLAAATNGGGHGGFGGRGALSIPPMPTWAMVSVIVGWLVVWTALGAWKMATRDA